MVRRGTTAASGLRRGEDRKRRPNEVRSSGAVKLGPGRARSTLLQIPRASAGLHAGGCVASENSGADINVKSVCGKRAYPISDAARCGIMYIALGVGVHGGRWHRYMEKPLREITRNSPKHRIAAYRRARRPRPNQSALPRRRPHEAVSGKPTTWPPILTRRAGVRKSERMENA